MDLIDRFKYIMKLNDLSPSAFADEIGVQRSSISHILSERNKPSLELIQKVLAKYPKISSDWLITGNTKIDSDDLINSAPIAVPEDKIALPPTPTAGNTNKQIKKVVIFYTDNTFEEIVSGS